MPSVEMALSRCYDFCVQRRRYLAGPKQRASALIVLNIVALFIIDRGFGALFPAYPPFLNKKTHSWDSYATDPRGYFRDVRLDEDGRRYFTIDRSHERDRKYESSGTDPRAFEVVAVGDSFTYGQGVRLEDVWVKRLEKGPGPGGKRIQGIDLAIGGANIREVFAEVRDELGKFKPSLVIYGYVLNDPIPEPAPGRSIAAMEMNAALNTTYDNGLGWDFINVRGPAIRSLRSWPMRWIGDRSRIMDYLLSVLERRRLSEETIRSYQELHDPAINGPGLQKTFDLISEMKERVERRGSRFLVAIFPIFYNIQRDYPFAGVHRYIAERLRQIGVESLDLQPALSRYPAEKLWVHPTDQHPNELAHAVVADELRGWIARQDFGLGRPSGVAHNGSHAESNRLEVGGVANRYRASGDGSRLR
jgi:hypothetical protein